MKIAFSLFCGAFWAAVAYALDPSAPWWTLGIGAACAAYLTLAILGCSGESWRESGTRRW